jgi:hypothetical protein
VRLLFALLVTCCSTRYIPYPSTASELYTYAENFTRETGIKVPKIPLKFGKIEDPMTVGVCYKVNILQASIPYEIVIDERAWRWLSDLEREALMYHELLHCSADAEHNDERLEDGCPASIMASQLVSPQCYERYKQQYIQEFKR